MHTCTPTCTQILRAMYVTSALDYPHIEWGECRSISLLLVLGKMFPNTMAGRIRC